ncbi:hypothetical protein [Pontiella sulfatireligans]|uniref:hypothetical protein n=1 Tax=Pontiella sulfatireligans TaxID=2750658 RepID=UPI00109D6943|nr:hypothetical protein [Pontiella sulfatireligans]
MDKDLKILLSGILALFGWIGGAFALYIGFMRLFHLILGPDTGGRSEVSRMLVSTILIGLVTFFAIRLLKRKSLPEAAFIMSIIASLAGGFFIFIIFAFGGFHYLFGIETKPKHDEVEITPLTEYLSTDELEKLTQPKQND